MVSGTHIIRGPYYEALCIPLRSGGWRVMTSSGTTEHPHVGDPYLARDRHLEALRGEREMKRWTLVSARELERAVADRDELRRFLTYALDYTGAVEGEDGLLDEARMLLERLAGEDDA